MPTQRTEPVDFIILGAAKAGTTSLYHYLKAHPRICMSRVKETMFFALEGRKADFSGPGDRQSAYRHAVTSLEAYEASFQGCEAHMLRGEASPMYLHDPRAPENIKRHAPNARLIAVLRNPIERAYSAYMHLRRDQREPCKKFSDALKAEQERIAKGYGDIWHYTTLGFYGRQLRSYLEYFDREQILILFHEDLCKDRNGVLDTIYRFLDIETGYYPSDDSRHNSGGIPKNERLHRFVYRVIQGDNWFRSLMQRLFPESFRTRVATRIRLFEARVNLKKYDEISPEDKAYLIDLYRSDIEELQQLVGRDLGHWLQ